MIYCILLVALPFRAAPQWEKETIVPVAQTTFERKRLFLVLCVANVIAGIVFLGAVFGLGGQSDAGGLPNGRVIMVNRILTDPSPTTEPCSPLDASAKVACTWL